jgi:hypothetical protein
MSALDKLNAKAVKRVSVKKKDIPAKVDNLKDMHKESDFENVKIISENAKSPKTKKKHPGGRTNVRGKKGEDYRMVNIAMPTDLYDRIREESHGNMTFFINQILRKSLGD